jgi:hypothetical protein
MYEAYWNILSNLGLLLGCDAMVATEVALPSANVALLNGRVEYT